MISSISVALVRPTLGSQHRRLNSALLIWSSPLVLLKAKSSAMSASKAAQSVLSPHNLYQARAIFSVCDASLTLACARDAAPASATPANSVRRDRIVGMLDLL